MVPKGAQLMAARVGARASVDRRAIRLPVAVRLGRLVARWRPRGVFLAMTFLALGAFGGVVAGRVTANAAGHREGACIALNMAAALGYLDDRQRHAVMRILATAVNPDVDLFPGGRRAIAQACDAVARRGAPDPRN